VNLFSLLIGIGGSLGLLQVARRAPEREALRWTVAGLGVLAAALIGARLNYILLHPEFYRAAPLDVLRIWLGGLSWPGAFIFALFALAAAAAILRKPLDLTSDRLEPLFPAVTIMTWLGCSPAGCAYGAETLPELPWALKLPDEYGTLAYRWPLQLTAAASLMLILWWVDRRSARLIKLPGGQACVTGLVLALHTLLFSYLRADNPPTWRNFRLDLATAGALGFLCLLGLIWLGVRQLRASYSKKATGASRKFWFSSRG